MKRKAEGGRTFSVTASQEWNVLPLLTRKAESLSTFKNSLWKMIFKDQQSLIILLYKYLIWFVYSYFIVQ